MLPNSLGWVLLTCAIGIAFLVLAILGFEKLSKFGEACSPWIFGDLYRGRAGHAAEAGRPSQLRQFS